MPCSFTRSNPCFVLALVLAVGALFTPGRADVIQPDETASQDNFVYEFLPTSNLEAFPGFNIILSVNHTGTGHDNESFLRFDLSTVALGAGQVTEATLDLWVIDATQFNGSTANPSPATPVVVDLFEITEPWTEGVTWNTRPAQAGSPDSSITIEGINRWVSFDVTALVQGWLTDPSANHGIALRSPNVVIDASSGLKASTTFASSAFASEPLRPRLTLVPEPTTAGLIGLGGLMLLRRRTK